MSEFIRMYGLKISHNGSCNKCGEPRDRGDHSRCDRWPIYMGASKGFSYVSNSKESTLADLKSITAAICAGDDDATPVRFEIKILQTRAFNPVEAATPVSENEIWAEWSDGNGGTFRAGRVKPKAAREDEGK